KRTRKCSADIRVGDFQELHEGRFVELCENLRIALASGDINIAFLIIVPHVEDEVRVVIPLIRIVREIHAGRDAIAVAQKNGYGLFAGFVDVFNSSDIDNVLVCAVVVSVASDKVYLSLYHRIVLLNAVQLEPEIKIAGRTEEHTSELQSREN